MDAILQDLRNAIRQLIKRPGFTLTAVLTLTLGIGATTTVYSLANWILLRPIPGTNDDGRLVAVLFAHSRGYKETSYLDYRDFVARATAFSGLAGEARGGPVTLRTPGLASRQLRGDMVTANYFDVLGVRRYLGRFLDSMDILHGAPAVAVLSHRLWVDTFGADSGVIGRTVDLSKIPTTIVGVAPPGFGGTERVVETDLWRPITVKAATPVVGIDMYSSYFEGRRFGLFPELIGRLAPGVTAAQAESQLKGILGQLTRDFVIEAMGLRGITAEVHRGLGVPVTRREAVTATLRLLWLIAGTVMIIAVANVTNMLLFRGVSRRGELAVRRALGASGARLAGQSMVEGLVISVLAGGSAVVFAAWLSTAFSGFKVTPFLSLGEVPMDWRVLGFGLLLGALTGAAVGLVPALVSGSPRFGAGLRERAGGSRRGYVRGTMAVLQLASSLTLLVGALLLIGTLRNLRGVDLGFEPKGLSVFALETEGTGTPAPVANALRDAALARIRTLPGVTGATPTYLSPFSGGFGGCLPASRDVRNPEVEIVCLPNVYIRSNYFDVLGTPIVTGRGLADLDSTSADAAKSEVVISGAAARRLFGGEDPVGKKFELRNLGGPLRDVILGRYVEQPPEQLTVVGVARDSRWVSVVGQEIYGPLIYRNLGRVGANTPQATNGITILVRSGIPFATLKPSVEAILRSLAPTLTITSSSMVDKVDASLADQRLFARVVGLLTVLAVILAGVGLYALVAFSVAQRTREFGIRIALGARVQEILDLVVWQGAALAGIGVILGLGGAVALSRVLSHRLFGVTPLEPHIYLLAIALLVLLTLIASSVPARAATKVDPMVALRSE